MTIESILHLFIGQQVYIFPPETIEDGMLARYKSNYPNGNETYTLTTENFSKTIRDGYLLALRPIGSMTEDEACHVTDAALEGRATLYVNAELSLYLLSKGFDVLNLIEKGLAVDLTKIQKINRENLQNRTQSK